MRKGVIDHIPPLEASQTPLAQDLLWRSTGRVACLGDSDIDQHSSQPEDSQ
jgi:hypothetical protein